MIITNSSNTNSNALFTFIKTKIKDTFKFQENQLCSFCVETRERQKENQDTQTAILPVDKK